MIDCKCCFAITLIKDDFSCQQAQKVTRRGGPDISCGSERGSRRCAEIYEKLKIHGLPAFNAEDDLLTTPVSVYTKIQFGGLIGLHDAIKDDTNHDTQTMAIDNIYQLLENALVIFQSIDDIPYNKLIDPMTTYKIKRQKKRDKS